MSEDFRCPHSGDNQAAGTAALAVGPSQVVLGVPVLPPISPFKYIVDFNVQLWLFPYPCIQIMNCSATSLRKGIAGVPMN